MTGYDEADEEKELPCLKTSNMYIFTDVNKYSNCDNNNDDLKKCVPLQRALPVFKFYESAGGSSSKSFMPQFEDQFRSYSVVDLISDLQHVVKVHCADPSHFSERLEQLMGSPCASECAIHEGHFRRRRLRFQRGMPQRSLDSQRKDTKTKPMNNSDIKQETRRELVQKVLDKYHSYLFHTCTQGSFPFPEESYLKFVTLIDSETDSDDEKSHPDLPVYLFGTNLLYHDASVKTSREQEMELIVKPVYKDLKDELLNNDHYALELDEYEEIVKQAEVYQKTDEVLKVTARTGGLNLNISPGSAITVQHLMALIIYCDDETIQHVFTNNCRKTSSSESLETLRSKNEQIAIWSRSLRECVLYFGQSLPAGEFVYRGINGKLALSQIQAALWSPTSTTANVCVANSFINDRKKGMIIRLFNDRGRGAMYFDCSLLSNFVEEREKLFYGGVLIIDNVKLTNNELTPYGDTSVFLQAIHLMQLIIGGRPFAHNKRVFGQHVQETLQVLIELYLHLPIRNAVPPYLVACFKSCVQTKLIDDITKTLISPVCILQSHWRQLNPKLLEYFVHFVSTTEARKGLFLQYVEAIKKQKHGRDISLVIQSEDSLVLSQQILERMFNTKHSISVAKRINVLYFEQVHAIRVMLTYDSKRKNVCISIPLKLEGDCQWPHTLGGFLYITEGPVTIVQLLLEINGQKDVFGEWLYSRQMDLALWKACEQVTVHFALGFHGNNNIVSPFLEQKEKQHSKHDTHSLADVRELKAQGNEHFKSKQYIQALSCYEGAARMITSMLTSGILKDPAVVDPILLACSNNKALMKLKLRDFAGCVSVCDLILEWDNRNKKAFWRKAAALAEQQKWLEAKSVCEDYLRMDPRDPDLTRLRQKIVSRLK